MQNCVKRILVFALFISVLSFSTSVSSMSLDDAPILVLDVSNDALSQVSKFRTSEHLADKAINKLNSSASGQFSAYGLKKILSMLPVQRQNLWIVDLRQESHGFIDGNSVSWYANRNQANMNKSRVDIQREENKLLHEISNLSEVKAYKIKKLGHGKISGDQETIFTSSKIESEDQLVTNLGANYLRLYVLDHHRPDDYEVDQFVNFVKTKLRPDDWLHFHCRGGKGRSSTFMALHDMMKNASRSTFEEIMQRQIEIGNIDLSKISISPDKLWKSDAIKIRYKFLQEFYNYAASPHGFPKQSWTTWVQNSATIHK